MEENLFQTLLRGYENIDLMRTEINQVVKMVMGFLKHDKTFFKNRPRNTETNTDVAIHRSGVTWTLMSSSYLGTFDFEIKVYCGSTFYRFNLLQSDPVIYLEDVEVVHGSLEDFVKGMLRLCPSLEVLWQPLVQVANKF